MTLTTLLINIGIAALILSGIIIFVFKKHKEMLTTFLQCFCGVLFLFSGWVKAVDPLGTAYKMEQYFTEFETTFAESGLSFLAPLFPFLSNYSVSFSVIMIIFEILLGLMLILGSRPRFTAWAFFLLVAFFTVLTGFTYLTGYVPAGVNFFSFGDWGPYLASNMKVTDCGCFGDFIKLEPKTSFLKDVFLLIPAIYFIVRRKQMHLLIKENVNNWILGLSLVGLLFYCLSNFVWNLPHTDFRPFNIGKDVRATHAAEQDAMASVEITDWVLQNKADGNEIKISNNEYMKNYKQYPKDQWSVVDQIKTEPAIKSTKISEFELSSIDGEDISYKFLEEDGAKILVVSPKIKSDISSRMAMVSDSLFRLDTLVNEDGEQRVNRVLDTVIQKEEKVYEFKWDKKFSRRVHDELKPVLKGLANAKVPLYYAVGGAGVTELEALQKDFNLQNIELCMADDILLKTIIRSNPGVVLWKDGKIVNKWHINKLPKAEQILKDHF